MLAILTLFWVFDFIWCFDQDQTKTVYYNLTSDQFINSIGLPVIFILTGFLYPMEYEAGLSLPESGKLLLKRIWKLVRYLMIPYIVLVISVFLIGNRPTDAESFAFIADKIHFALRLGLITKITDVYAVSILGVINSVFELLLLLNLIHFGCEAIMLLIAGNSGSRKSFVKKNIKQTEDSKSNKSLKQAKSSAFRDGGKYQRIEMNTPFFWLQLVITVAAGAIGLALFLNWRILLFNFTLAITGLLFAAVGRLLYHFRELFRSINIALIIPIGVGAFIGWYQLAYHNLCFNITAYQMNPIGFLTILLGFVWVYALAGILEFVPVISTFLNYYGKNYLFFLCTWPFLLFMKNLWFFESELPSKFMAMVLGTVFGLIAINIKDLLGGRLATRSEPDTNLQKISDILFYVIFAYYFFISFLGTTLLPQSGRMVDICHRLSLYGTIIAALCFSVYCFQIKRTGECWFKVILFVLLCLYQIYGSGTGAFSVMVLMLAASGKSSRVIIKTDLLISVALMAISYWASMNGYIPYLVYANDTKHAFGIAYHTDLAAHLLYVVIAYCMLKPKRFKWWILYDISILGFAAFFDYRYIGARANLANLLLLLVGTLLFDLAAFFRKEEKTNHSRELHPAADVLSKAPLGEVFRVLYGIIAIPIFIYFEVLVLIVCEDYPGLTSQRFMHLFRLFTDTSSLENRIAMSKAALNVYPLLNMWGFQIYEHGAGGVGTGTSTEPYFFLDMSYIRLPLLFGSVITLIFLTVMTWWQIQNYRSRRYYWMFIGMIIAFSGIIEHHLLDPSYNFINYLVFSAVCERYPDSSGHDSVINDNQTVGDMAGRVFQENDNVVNM